MGTRVETLQAPRAGGSILIAAFLASLVMLTIAVTAISLDQGRQGGTSFAGRHLVNTPSELSAGIVGGTAANTPSELFGSRGDPAAVRQKYVSDKLGTNTPSEFSGWSSPPASRHKFTTDTIGTNTPAELSGGILGGLPARIYDRHQRG
jgi:hypothetical protein